VISLSGKADKQRKNDNKTPNDKRANPITMEVKPDASEPVRGLPKV
jgi:hypothetical protein